LHELRNAQHEPLVSSDASSVTVRIIRTDEESVIASLTIGALGLELKG